MINVNHMEVQKTARYYTLGTAGPRTREIWVVCHGYGYLAADFTRHFLVLEAGHRLVVVPEALHRFYLFGTGGKVGASWMTREDRERDIRDYTRYLDALYRRVLAEVGGSGGAVESLTLTVLGFSQGGATASRWAVGGSVAADRLIVWGSDLPTDVPWAEVARRGGGPTVDLVFGTRDPYLEKAPKHPRKQALELENLGLTVHITAFEGGHDIDAPTLTALAGGRRDGK